MMRCKIDDGTLDSLGQDGYIDRWKCRRCKVVWELRPLGDIDTDREVLTDLIEKRYKEYVNEH